MANVKTKKDKRKLLDIPESSLSNLSKMAERERMSLKAYMEKILIKHSDKNKRVLD